jgi:excisionase family DNA binding protein
MVESKHKGAASGGEARPELEGGLMEKPHPYNIAGSRRRPVSPARRRAIPGQAGSGDVSSHEDVKLPPPLMTVEELAVLLRTSKGAVYARFARGGIPGGLRLGRTLRFDPRIIAQWLSANSASAGGQP